MRIPSGKTDQVIYFVALDTTDGSRKTGLSSFAVYRSRNGGAATLYTTPTVAELSAANMPGVYGLTVDEDTTIGSSSDSEEYAVHITATGMQAVTRTVELYRRDTTSGRTLGVDASGNVSGSVASVVGHTPQTGDTFARIGAAGAGLTALGDTRIANLDATVSSRLATSGYTAPLSAAGVRSAIGLASANLDTQLDALPTTAEVNAEVDTALADVGLTTTITGRIDAAVTSRSSHSASDIWAVGTRALTDKAGFALSSAGVQAIWDALTSALTTVGSVGKRIADNLDAAITSRLATAGYTAPPTAVQNRQEMDSASTKLANLDATVSSRSTLSAAQVNAEADAALADVGLTGTVTGRIDAAVSTRSSHSAADIWAAVTRSLTDKAGFSLSSAGIQAIWDALTSALTTVGSIGKLLVDNINATISSRLATAGYTAPDNAGITTLTGRLTAQRATNLDNLDAAVSSRLATSSYSAPTAPPTANENADALLDRADAIETGLTFRKGFRLVAAILGGKLSGAGTTTETFRNAVADSKDRVAATVDASGNRSAIALDLT